MHGRTTGLRRAPESLCVPGVSPNDGVHGLDGGNHLISVWAGWDKEPLQLRVDLPRRTRLRVRFMSDDGAA